MVYLSEHTGWGVVPSQYVEAPFIYFQAEEAGRISIRQYKLSQMLGDDSLAARSRLYSALSQAQKGNLHIARNIVRSVADFARVTHDKRLMRMCQGVWAKLKYLRCLKKKSTLEQGNTCDTKETGASN